MEWEVNGVPLQRDVKLSNWGLLLKKPTPKSICPLNTGAPRRACPNPPCCPGGSRPMLLPALPGSCLLVYFLDLAPPAGPCV